MLLVAHLLALVAWLLVTAFPIRYVWSMPSWYRTYEGRYLVLSKTAFSLILALGPLVWLVPSLARWPGWAFVRVAVYLVLCAVFAALNIMLSKARRARRAASVEGVPPWHSSDSPGGTGGRSPSRT